MYKNPLCTLTPWGLFSLPNKFLILELSNVLIISPLLLKTRIYPSIFWLSISKEPVHATKIFNSGEGGACFSKSPILTERMKKLRFFGHNDEGEIVDQGINGKLTEVHSAIGLANLPYVKKTINRRKEIFFKYHSYLSANKDIRFQSFNPEEYNYSYMPIVFSSESQLTRIVKKLNDESIYPRRYFYPSLNTVTTIQTYQKMKNSELLSKNILCLPSYTTLGDKDIELISKIILKNV